MKTRSKFLAGSSPLRLQIFLFLLIWFGYGAAINSGNLIDFDLQQIGVEAIVERGHFYLDHSIPGHRQTKGDVFEYAGHNYAAKQPGQFMAGAVVYFVLHKFGLSYFDHYLLAAALVTFFTTSLALASSALALFNLARGMTADERGLFWPLAATLTYALATTVFAYSGIAHHDALVTGYLVVAFSLIFQVSRERARMPALWFKAAGAGLLLGLTITTSMLPFFMVALCLCYFLALRRWKLLPFFLAGLIGGLLPLFIYDAVSFGNPFLLPNVAGAGVFSDTFLYFEPANLGDKLASYAKSLTLYVPVFAVGLFGLSYYPRRIKRGVEFLVLAAMLTAMALFVVNIKSDGDCQFGPRYLLPAIPFACVGIAGYSYLATATERRLAGLVVILLGLLSFTINLAGATRGVMSCPHGEGALSNKLATIQNGVDLTYPLAAWLLVPFVICAALFVQNVAAWRTRQS